MAVIDVVSPDGFSIYFGRTFRKKDTAKKGAEDWVTRYKQQGYYSSPRYGRIPYNQILDHCNVLVFEKGELKERINFNELT